MEVCWTNGRARGLTRTMAIRYAPESRESSFARTSGSEDALVAQRTNEARGATARHLQSNLWTQITAGCRAPYPDVSKFGGAAVNEEFDSRAGPGTCRPRRRQRGSAVDRQHQRFTDKFEHHGVPLVAGNRRRDGIRSGRHRRGRRSTGRQREPVSSSQSRTRASDASESWIPARVWPENRVSKWMTAPANGGSQWSVAAAPRPAEPRVAPAPDVHSPARRRHDGASGSSARLSLRESIRASCTTSAARRSSVHPRP